MGEGVEGGLGWTALIFSTVSTGKWKKWISFNKIPISLNVKEFLIIYFVASSLIHFYCQKMRMNLTILIKLSPLMP